MNSLKEANESFAIATVIIVKGSSSGKTGDKAIFDKNGKRILGWLVAVVLKIAWHKQRWKH